MKVLTNLLGRFTRTKGKKLAVTAAVVLSLAGAGVAGISAIRTSTVSAGDCSGNSIIKCGEPNRQSLINAVKASPELQKVYASFGLKSTDYSRFVSSAVPGVAYSNNTIVVNKQVVATNVGSIGRYASYQGSGYRTFAIAGAGTYYGNVDSKSFAKGVTALPVDVLFDASGKIQFAVMTNSCANPTYQTPNAPTYQCKDLQSTSLGNNKWSFTTDASAGNGAKITKLVYNFGDGTTATTTSPSAAVTHTFTKSTTVTVSVYVSVPGGGTVVLTNCKKAITFTPPPAVFACDLLTVTPGTVDNSGNQAYTLAAKASATNATIKSYTFTFGDNTSATVVSGQTAVTTTHTYAPGNYTAKVAVTVLTDTGATQTVSSANCAKPVTVKTPECKPGVPMGSPQCQPSTLACVSLTPAAGTPDATTGDTLYTFTAKATASNATITSYSFDFGDSSAAQSVSTGATTASTTHTYMPGTATATVTVTGKDASGNTITAAANVNCSTPITVKTPECKPGVPMGSPQCQPSSLVCVSLTSTPGAVDQSGNQTFTFTAVATQNNATITDYAFDFGDTNVVHGSATQVTHTYAPGNYTATVTVSGTDANGSTVTAPATVHCTTPITVKSVECKPGVPAGSSQCFTCDAFTVTKGDNRLVTVGSFTASPAASLSSVTINWGDNTSNTYTPASSAVGQTHQYTTDGTFNIVATANFGQTPVNSDACNQNVTFATVTTLVNTGTGNIVGLFGASAIIATIAHRLFLGRKLRNQN